MPKVIRINPQEIPPKKDESWWIVHPNNGNVEFKVPPGAVTVCTKEFMSFRSGKVYPISYIDEQSGYITVKNREEIVEMPYYIFGRYFDAEAFVRPTVHNYYNRLGPPKDLSSEELIKIKKEIIFND